MVTKEMIQKEIDDAHIIVKGYNHVIKTSTNSLEREKYKHDKAYAIGKIEAFNSILIKL